MSNLKYLPEYVLRWFVNLFEQEAVEERQQDLKLLKEDGLTVKAFIGDHLEEAMLCGLGLARKDYCLTSPHVNMIYLFPEECASEVLRHLSEHFSVELDRL